jgi:hypothetical protein
MNFSRERTIPFIPASNYYSTLQQYQKNGDFGFMKFNPPLSPPVFYPYMRKFDAPPIKYQTNYDTLLHVSDTFPNLNQNYSSISNAYKCDK